jgi:hypothetical protein
MSSALAMLSSMRSFMHRARENVPCKVNLYAFSPSNVKKCKGKKNDDFMAKLISMAEVKARMQMLELTRRRSFCEGEKFLLSS